MSTVIVSVERFSALEAEAQALREERDRIERNRDMWKGQCERQAEKLAALRARVVVPERAPEHVYDDKQYAWARGHNACLDELARLNGKAVSEGLLRRIAAGDKQLWPAIGELRALLGEGKEVGDAEP